MCDIMEGAVNISIVLLQNVAQKITCFRDRYVSMSCMFVSGFAETFFQAHFTGDIAFHGIKQFFWHNHRDCQGMSGLLKPGHEESHRSDED